MTYRKLRIAWSVVWAILAVLLIVLWVRSYTWCDTARLLPAKSVTLVSIEGRLTFEAFDSSVPMSTKLFESVSDDLECRYRKKLAEVAAAGGDPLIARLKWCRIDRDPLSVTAYGPHWVALLTTVPVSLLPWLPIKRFSLRTLLIVTTIVGLMLGILVWLI